MADAFSQTAIGIVGLVKQQGPPKSFFDQRPYAARLFTAITNHTYATELCLKSCLMVTENKKVTGHKTWDLLKRFDRDHRSMLEARYQRALRDLSGHAIIEAGDEFGLAYGANGDEVDVPDQPQTMSDLLKYINEWFVTYRYAHEQLYAHGIVYFPFEIEAACMALKTYHHQLVEDRTGMSFGP